MDQEYDACYGEVLKLSIAVTQDMDAETATHWRRFATTSMAVNIIVVFVLALLLLLGLKSQRAR